MNKQELQLQIKENFNSRNAAKLHKLLDAETKRKVAAVEGAEEFGISTAYTCPTSNEFILVSEHELTPSYVEALEVA